MSAATYWKRVQELARDLYPSAKAKAPLDGVLFAKVANLGTYSADDVRALGVPLEEANVITSATTEGLLGDGSRHKVVIDLDLPAQLIPSTTEGHFHLLIDHAMPWEAYVELLKALVAAKLVEPGYLGASEARGYTAVRLPWVAKEVEA